MEFENSSITSSEGIFKKKIKQGNQTSCEFSFHSLIIEDLA